MATKKEPQEMLTARVPAGLLKQLDRAADKSRRSRSAEVVVRLQESLRGQQRRSAA